MSLPLGHEPHPDFKAASAYWWPNLVLLFDLPRPDAFPPFTVGPSPDQAATISRYHLQVARLTQSSALFDPASVKVSLDAGQIETVEATLPGYEAASSLAATFRSLYSHSEPAGFSKIAGLARSRSRAEPEDTATRLDMISAWTRGVATLRKRQAEQLAAEKLGWSDPPLIGGKRPDEIIRIYLYGEYLHWDRARGADQIAEWQADSFSEAFFRMQFLQAVTPLAYLYMGFDQLLRYADRDVLSSRSTPARPDDPEP
jgi:hypothetical protein